MTPILSPPPPYFGTVGSVFEQSAYFGEKRGGVFVLSVTVYAAAKTHQLSFLQPPYW